MLKQLSSLFKHPFHNEIHCNLFYRDNVAIKYKLLALLMTLTASLLLDDQVQAAGLKWKFNNVTQGIDGKESHESIIYSVSPGVSIIEHEQEIIHINYAERFLYRYNKVDGDCLRFPLHSSQRHEATDTETNAKKRTLSLVSSMKIFPSTERKKIHDHQCTVKNILFGADLAKLKMVAPLMVNKFNQKFSESMVGYTVSDTIMGLNVLRKIAKSREEVFQHNPFLRQIDIVGLIEVLKGFPVQVNQRVGNLKIVTTLHGALEPLDKLESLPLPDSCPK